MSEPLLPLFPLAVVLLPSNTLPLHIFEDRYKEMIGQALATGEEFGVVLAADGGIARVGCTATVEEVTKRYPDGRLDIVTLGRRRFAIHEIDQGMAYVRGEVEFFSDEETESPPPLRERALEVCREVGPSGRELLDDPQLSFRLAGGIDDVEFRQQMLMSRSEADRLRRLIEFVPRYLVRQQRIDRMKRAAGHNGHSHHRSAGSEPG